MIYRIVGDKYGGFEVQKKYWFFWSQMGRDTGKPGGVNTFRTIEEAEAWIREGCPGRYPNDRKTLKVIEL